MLIYMYMNIIYTMSLLGIDFDKVTVANSVALIMMLAYLVFIFMGVAVPVEFHDLIKIIAAFLFLSKAYEHGNNNSPPIQ